MPVKTSKTRNAAPPVTKICSKCKQTRNLTDFYSNRDWTDQLGKDIWCKDCVSKCATKDELREYFWENCREWNEKLWSSSRKKAELAANKNKTYQKAFPETQKNILDRLTCQNVIKSMQINYKFEDHTNNIEVQTYQDAKEAGHVLDENPQEQDPNVKVYSEFFNGFFKQDELKYLEDYYHQLSDDFELSDVNLRDTAKKLAKQSLICDQIQDKYAAGKATIADVRDAMTLFDLLSKSGNFSASKRKPGDKGGMGSWSEITFYLESNGHPMTRKIEWPQDDIDKTIEEFRHIVEALDLSGA
jgi:hypothetical protein